MTRGMTHEQQFDCKDLERALREECPELLADLECHARTCAACAEELRIWRDISAAARAMHSEWESPALWTRIESALEEQAARPRGLRGWISGPRQAPGFRWQAALAVVVLLLVSGTGAWFIFFHRTAPAPVDDQQLLTDQAVNQADQAEKAYQASIDKLATLAEPKLDSSSSPLMVNYREKLQLLDSAIDECHRNLNENPANAHLQAELLSFYQEKQQTLEQVLRGK
jgi:hypothetical protein